MEPPQTEIVSIPHSPDFKTRYVINTKVVKVEERMKRRWVEKGGWGKDAAFENTSLGWFIHFDGSYESLYFGASKPEFIVGDKIKITFERIDDALPSQPPV